MMVGCEALKCAQKRTQRFDLFGQFFLSLCVECVIAGHNVFLGPTNHLPSL